MSTNEFLDSLRREILLNHAHLYSLAIKISLETAKSLHEAKYKEELERYEEAIRDKDFGHSYALAYPPPPSPMPFNSVSAMTLFGLPVLIDNTVAFMDFKLTEPEIKP